MRYAGFAAALALTGSGAAAQTAPSPTAVEKVAVIVLARPVARGEVLSLDDLTIEQRSSVQVRGALGAKEIAGREANRNLASGVIVRASDVVAPRLVRRGEPVVITLKSGGLTISTAGRALASGSTGDPVRVVSSVTNRTLDGIVEGPGAVRVAMP